MPSANSSKTPETKLKAFVVRVKWNTGVLDLIEREIHAGMSTADIDKLVYDYTVSHGAIPAPLNYEASPRAYVPASTRWCVTAFLQNMKYWRKATSSM